MSLNCSASEIRLVEFGKSAAVGVLGSVVEHLPGVPEPVDETVPDLRRVRRVDESATGTSGGDVRRQGRGHGPVDQAEPSSVAR